MVESTDNFVDLMGEAGQVDLCKEAFTAYSEADFKQSKE